LKKIKKFFACAAIAVTLAIAPVFASCGKEEIPPQNETEETEETGELPSLGTPTTYLSMEGFVARLGIRADYSYSNKQYKKTNQGGFGESEVSKINVLSTPNYYIMQEIGIERWTVLKSNVRFGYGSNSGGNNRIVWEFNYYGPDNHPMYIESMSQIEEAGFIKINDHKWRTTQTQEGTTYVSIIEMKSDGTVERTTECTVGVNKGEKYSTTYVFGGNSGMPTAATTPAWVKTVIAPNYFAPNAKSILLDNIWNGNIAIDADNGIYADATYSFKASSQFNLATQINESDIISEYTGGWSFVDRNKITLIWNSVPITMPATITAEWHISENENNGFTLEVFEGNIRYLYLHTGDEPLVKPVQ